MANVGIKELARVAGGSIATASRAMSNPGRVSDETREKVVEAAKRIGYTPNRLGASLRTSKTGNLIAIIPDVSDTFNFGVIKSLEKAASKRGYSMLLGDTQGERSRELAYGEMVKAKQADGIILFSYRLPYEIQDEQAFELPPIVNSCEWVGRDDIPFVAIDNKAAAKEGVQHLIDLGHKSIAVLTGDPSTPSSCARLEGCRAAIESAGLTLKTEHIIHGEYSLESGEAATLELLKLEDRPTAIFCFSDEIALGCMSALRVSGIDVPTDMSVIGFDDIKFAKYQSPSLTTIAQPVEAFGEHCVNMLVDIIDDNELEEKKLVLPHQLIVRESTAAPKS